MGNGLVKDKNNLFKSTLCLFGNRYTIFYNIKFKFYFNKQYDE